ncbi:MAG TPA: hypothetical protein VHG91_12725 [Longimicrobium sp.]|nr:hypothetical protein [Longimicrobium sp.]
MSRFRFPAAAASLVLAAARPAPSVAPARATQRESPKPPAWCPAVAKGRSKSGSVETLTTPPAAFPQSADALERTTSSVSTAPSSTRSSEVRPSGSVSGTPSWRTRIPRVVPALERSPAPRAP